MFVWLPACLSVSPDLCLPTCLSFRMTVVCLHVCLSVCAGGFDGSDGNLQIGRTPPLSSSKGAHNKLKTIQKASRPGQAGQEAKTRQRRDKDETMMRQRRNNDETKTRRNKNKARQETKASQRQDKTRGKTRQDKTRRDATKRDETRRDQTRQYYKIQDKIKARLRQDQKQSLHRHMPSLLLSLYLCLFV
jgi:hypothetical protein